MSIGASVRRDKQGASDSNPAGELYILQYSMPLFRVIYEYEVRVALSTFVLRIQEHGQVSTIQGYAISRGVSNLRK